MLFRSIPYHHLWIVFTGFALIAAGLSIATTIEDKYAACGLFVLFFGWLVLLHAPRIFHALHNADEWSSGFVVLAFSGTSLLLAASSSGAVGTLKKSSPTPVSAVTADCLVCVDHAFGYRQRTTFVGDSTSKRGAARKPPGAAAIASRIGPGCTSTSGRNVIRDNDRGQCDLAT